MVNNIVEKVRNTIEKYSMLPQGSSVLAAVSGGADSVSLLRLLCILRDEYSLSVCAAHVNHGLRGENAHRDESFVRELCEKWGVELFIKHADVSNLAASSGESIEQCGRRVRYGFFEQCANGGLIATAHTLSDSCETLMLNMARGCTLSGLCGIPPVRGKIIRPLIECSRADIEEFCQSEGLSFVTDETNSDTRFRRNLIRQRIVPRLFDINPSFDRAAARMIEQNRRDEAFLEEQTEAALTRARLTAGYDTGILASLSDAVKYRAAARICKGAEYAHVERVVSALCSENAKINLPRGMAAVIKDRVLTVEPAKRHPGGEFSARVIFSDGGGVADLPFARVKLTDCDFFETNGCQKVHNLLSYNVLDRDKIGKNILARSRLPGDSIRLPRRGCTKSLKKLWNEQKLPPKERERRIIVSDENGLLFVEGVGADARCAAGRDTKNALRVEILREENKND